MAAVWSGSPALSSSSLLASIIARASFARASISLDADFIASPTDLFAARTALPALSRSIAAKTSRLAISGLSASLRRMSIGFSSGSQFLNSPAISARLGSISSSLFSASWSHSVSELSLFVFVSMERSRRAAVLSLPSISRSSSATRLRSTARHRVSPVYLGVYHPVYQAAPRQANR